MCGNVSYENKWSFNHLLLSSTWQEIVISGAFDKQSLENKIDNSEKYLDKYEKRDTGNMNSGLSQDFQTQFKCYLGYQIVEGKFNGVLWCGVCNVIT